MSEKVLHEMRIIETEDGFRIEIKGDKERLRKMFDRGMLPFGLRHHMAPPWAREGRGHHRHGRGGHGHHHGPHKHDHDEDAHEHKHGRHRRWGFHGEGPTRFARYDLGPWFDEEPDAPEASSGETHTEV